MEIEGRLAAFLRDEEYSNIPGAFLLKLPSSSTRQAAIAIEVNPVESAESAAKNGRWYYTVLATVLARNATWEQRICCSAKSPTFHFLLPLLSIILLPHHNGFGK